VATDPVTPVAPVALVAPVAAVNLRPVGGSRASRIWRSGELGAADAGALAFLGRPTYVDLRSDAEVARAPLAVSLRAAGWRWVRAPITGYDHAALAAAVPSPEAYAAYYVAMLRTAGPQLCRALAAIAGALPDGKVVVGCHAGKDRTGVVSAALLELAGAGRELVIADYVAGNAALAAGLPRFRAKWERRGLTAELYRERLMCRPETLALVYAALAPDDLQTSICRHGLAPDAAQRLIAALALPRRTP
jgi:hypothetical protein